MPRTARALAGNVCYHIVNRGNARQTVFHDASDYRRFEALLENASKRIRMRLLSYCLMPNHFHLCVLPYEGTELSAWMAWLMVAHVRAHHARYKSCGRIWQGRFQTFPVQSDAHLLTVIRYIERNPLRANLVRGVEEWNYSSFCSREGLSNWPIDRPADWQQWVQEPQTDEELAALRRCTVRGAPFGDAVWAAATVRALGLESSLRARHRPVEMRCEQ